MAGEETARKQQFAISEQGGLFDPERVELLKEAAEHFADQGLILEILGDRNEEGEPWIDLEGYQDSVRVRITPGPHPSANTNPQGNIAHP